MHFHLVKMYKDKEVKNVNNFFVNVWRKNIFDIYVTEYGRYCFDNYFTYFVPVFKYCYSDSRNLWTVMRAGGLAL